ncbi:NAD(P)H-dependent flavin oxidoreductase, partial [Thermus scotoductus]|uniref:NAD(P)H-dependent flavin oxidoreductase n=5 Tax=Thermus scotoductus TaxID=37636 RepID=UPI0020A28E24
METAITRMLGIRYPIVAAPMFLVSGARLLLAVAEAGAIGVIPSLNFRTHAAFREFLETFPQGVPFGVNLILKNNPRLEEDLEAVAERKVPLVVTSLGDPTRVVEKVKAYGGVIWCDVVGLRHGRKAVEAGADALVAVPQAHHVAPDPAPSPIHNPQPTKPTHNSDGGISRTKKKTSTYT